MVTTIVSSIEDGSDNLNSQFPLWDTTNPQKVWSAITYAKRYNLCQIFNIVSDRDDDGNAASVKLPFTDKVLEKFKDNYWLYKWYDEAIKAIESKYDIKEKDKWFIFDLYS